MFIFENYEITITITFGDKDALVGVQLLDKLTHKLYMNSYDENNVSAINMTLDVFYKVLNTVFKALVDDNKENATSEIISSSNQIKFKIHHKFYVDFKFELCLWLNEETLIEKSDSNQLLIGKLDPIQQLIGNLKPTQPLIGNLELTQLLIGKLEQTINEQKKYINVLNENLDVFKKETTDKILERDNEIIVINICLNKLLERNDDSNIVKINTRVQALNNEVGSLKDAFRIMC